jgi:hypothetical protein
MTGYYSSMNSLIAIVHRFFLSRYQAASRAGLVICVVAPLCCYAGEGAVKVSACDLMRNLSEYHGKLVAVRGVMEETEPGSAIGELWAKNCTSSSQPPFSEPIALFEMFTDSEIQMPDEYRSEPDAQYNPASINQFAKTARQMPLSEPLRAQMTVTGLAVVGEDYASKQLVRKNETDLDEKEWGMLIEHLKRVYSNRSYRAELYFVSLRDPVFRK